jgi:hypothetical protein
MDKPIYTAISLSNFIVTLIVRLSAAFFLCFLFSFDLSTQTTIVLVFLCLYLFITTGHEQISIYEDRVIQATISLLSFLFKSNRKTLYIKQIQTAYAVSRNETNIISLTHSYLIDAVTASTNKWGARIRPIYFNLKQGETAVLYTVLDQNKIREIAELINSLIKKICH